MNDTLQENRAFKEKLNEDAIDDASDDGLSDVFYSGKRKCQLVLVKLNKGGFTLQKESRAKEKTIKICDIVGGRCVVQTQKRSFLSMHCNCNSSCSVVHQGSKQYDKKRELGAYFYIFAYVLKSNLRNIVYRERTVLTLRFCSYDSFEENMREAERWHKTLMLYKQAAMEPSIYLQANRYRRRLLLFLNPKAGSGKARRLFHHNVAPIFNEADLLYDLVVTKHINYARKFVEHRDLSAWSSIVAIGGDGLFFEILNGLLKRPDCRMIMQTISLGVIPCGLSNGLAKSICHIYKEPYEPKPILSSALTIVKGQTALMDIVRLTVHNKILYSFLSVGWGLISDIDIESERLRLLGYRRFTLCSLHRLISLKTYRGRVSYVPKTTTDYASTSSTPPAIANALSKSCSEPNGFSNTNNLLKSTERLCYSKHDNISLETSFNQSFRSGLESWCSLDSCGSNYCSIAESIYHSVPSEKESDQDSISVTSNDIQANFDLEIANTSPKNWIVEEGEFVMVHASYQTHINADCFIAPPATLNDGIIYIVIVRNGISRPQLLQFLLSLSSGTHFMMEQNSYVKVVAVDAFRIEPFETNGIMTVDGERIEFGPLQGNVVPGAVKIMVPSLPDWSTATR